MTNKKGIKTEVKPRKKRDEGARVTTSRVKFKPRVRIRFV